MSTKKIFITLFAVLYLCVGLVSTIHAISFFGLANAPVLGTILAITFEIGQAAVLFNLLTSPQQRKKIMPWALMCILTLVQVLGNIFSSYKYLMLHSSEDLKFFKEPIFVWTDLPDNITTVIVTYIVGAILPIVALCLTEMVVSYLNYTEESKEEEIDEEDIKENITGETIVESKTHIDPNKFIEKLNKKQDSKEEEETTEDKVEEEKEEPIVEDEPLEDKVAEEKVDEPEPVKEIIPTEQTVKDVNSLINGFEEDKVKKSHFINI